MMGRMGNGECGGGGGVNLQHLAAATLVNQIRYGFHGELVGAASAANLAVVVVHAVEMYNHVAEAEQLQVAVSTEVLQESSAFKLHLPSIL